MAVSPALIFTTIVVLLTTSTAQSLVTRSASTSAPLPRLHIVDQSGKIAGSYPELSAAVQVARPGDTIHVGPGTYQAISVHKGVRILAEFGAFLDVTYGPFIISDIPREQTLVLAGFEFKWPRPVRVQLKNNEGQVHLSDLRVLPMLVNRAPGITIERSAFVSLDRCTTHGTPALKITDSEVMVSACELQGIGDYRGKIPGHALHATRSKVFVCQPYLRGYTDNMVTLSTAAIRLDMSEIWIKGDATSYVQGGCTLPGTAVTPIDGGYFSTVYLDPSTPLSPFASSGAKITSRTNVKAAPLAMVTASGRLAPGGVLNANLLASPSALCAIVIGVPKDRNSTLFGDTWLRASSAIRLGIGLSDLQGRFSVSFRIPPQVSTGSCVLLQGFVDAGKGPRLTLPSVTVIH